MNLRELLGQPQGTSADEAFEAALTAMLLDHHRRAGGDETLLPALAEALQALHAALRRGQIAITLDDGQRDRLAQSAIVGDATRPAPLMLDGHELLLHRYWRERRSVWQRLAALHRTQPPRDAARLQQTLDALFPPRADGGVDWQKTAAINAAQHGLTVIAGGPGTGKTTTVVRLLAALLQDNPALTVALAAPTGKAAARMGESIRNQLEHLPLQEGVRRAMPTEAQTLHRLLGSRGDGQRWRYGADHPLPATLVVIDECSMLDIALLARLLDALRDDARLVLVGDPQQLGAVEPGAPFAEIARNATDNPVAAAVITLRESHRFRADGPLGLLAGAILHADAEAAIATLTGQPDWQPNLPDTATLLTGYAPFIAALRNRDSAPAAVLAAFDRHRLLAATHAGSGGTRHLNTLLAAGLQQALATPAREALWYHGRPVLVRQNDYALRLFNGDIGVCLADNGGDFAVHFPESGGGTRHFDPARLPAHETAFAISVHQSQGSEFDSIDLVLDPVHGGMANRALLYTAVTRARHTARLWASVASLRAALARA
jgi:exodeoxyribonuclease V alpha subunit